MLQVSRRVEYGLRAAIFLAGIPPGERVPFREIAEHEHAPVDFMAKVLRSLVDAGIAESHRGASGGYSLAKEPQTVTFLHVIEAMEGPISINDCTEQGTGCSLISACGMQRVWRDAERALLDVFSRTRITDVTSPLDLRLGPSVDAHAT